MILIDDSCSNPCKKKCYENVVVESCDDLIAKENDELKKEVERLMKDLARLKGKSIVQPSQDNREDMVKKVEKGATVTCFKCHQEGHKSYQCTQPKKMVPNEKNKKSFIIKSSLIYTKPNRKIKSKSTSYAIKKKGNGKVVAHKVGKKDWSWNCSIWVPKEVITNMKGLQMVWVAKEI
jgi:cobalamin biosynthesis Co2+ chelatase CbiK